MIRRPPNSAPDGGRVEVSVVVPAHNEEDNIAPLLDQFGELARKARFSLEVVLVDDGSTDQTLPRAVEAQRSHRFVRVVSLPYRRGLTEALRAGFAVARGDILVFYPADRQFHPSDIPRMVEKVRSGFDLVTGRKIGQYGKRIVSGFYNRLSRILFPSIQVTDLNSVKAFRRELIDVLDYRHDWHRFWVAIVSEAGYRIGEVDVTLYDRPSGRSKYGMWRIPGAVLDLLAVKFQYHTMRRPLWYFGLSGMVLLALGFIIGLVALYHRYVIGTGNRNLLLLVMTLGLSGVVLFAIGFLAESVAGIRQQIESMRSSPRYQVYRPGPPVRTTVDSPPQSARRDDRAEGPRGRDRRTGPSTRTRRPPRTTERPPARVTERPPTRTAEDTTTGPERIEARPLKIADKEADTPHTEPDVREQESLSLAFPASGAGAEDDRTDRRDDYDRPEEPDQTEPTSAAAESASDGGAVQDKTTDEEQEPRPREEAPTPVIRGNQYGRRGRR